MTEHRPPAEVIAEYSGGQRSVVAASLQIAAMTEHRPPNLPICNSLEGNAPSLPYREFIASSSGDGSAEEEKASLPSSRRKTESFEYSFFDDMRQRQKMHSC